MISDFDFNKTESPDAKQITKFLDEMHFNKRATGKSNSDRTLIKNYYNKTSILASGLRTVFISENPDELCDRIKLLPQKNELVIFLIKILK